MRTRQAVKRQSLGDLLWLIPLAYAAASFALALTIPHVEYSYAMQFGSAISVSSAQAFLSSVSSGMMALTAIVFSLVFVFSQFSATAYSPRLTVELGRNRAIYHAFGCFIATFTYSLVTLVWVDYGKTGRVPAVSLCIVGALIAISLVYLAQLIRSLARMNIMFVLNFIGKNGRRVIEGYPAQTASTAAQCAQTGADASGLPPTTLTLNYDGPPSLVAEYDLALLTEQAGSAGAVIVLDPAVGDSLVDGSRLLSVHGGNRNLSANDLLRGIRLSPARTFRQDPKYAFRLLVDIAIRALSPAINDPTTAVQALDQIEDLLSRLGRRELPSGRVRDDDGALRVVFPAPTWEDFLGLAFDEIRHYGRDSIQIIRRLRAALRRLAETLNDPSRKEAVRRYKRHLDEAVLPSDFDADDRASALCEDTQGIGVSRHENLTAVNPLTL